MPNIVAHQNQTSRGAKKAPCHKRNAKKAENKAGIQTR